MMGATESRNAGRSGSRTRALGPSTAVLGPVRVWQGTIPLFYVRVKTPANSIGLCLAYTSPERSRGLDHTSKPYLPGVTCPPARADSGGRWYMPRRTATRARAWARVGSLWWRPHGR